MSSASFLARPAGARADGVARWAAQLTRVPVSAWLGVATMLAVVTYAVVVPWVAGVDPAHTDFASAGLPPGRGHLFGTDSQGHDLFIRLAAGLRISLLIALLTAIFSSIVGTGLGIVAGFAGGRVDQFIMRFTDGINALPHLLLGLVIVSMFPGSVPAIIASLVLTHWVTITRAVRAEVMGLRTAHFVEASYLAGLSKARILGLHFIPAALGQALVGLVLLIPHAVWHESTLSFLGVGLPPHHPSLGTLLADAEGALLLGHWWILVFPSVLLIATTLSVAAVGHAVKNLATTGESEKGGL